MEVRFDNGCGSDTCLGMRESMEADVKEAEKPFRAELGLHYRIATNQREHDRRLECFKCFKCWIEDDEDEGISWRGPDFLACG